MYPIIPVPELPLLQEQLGTKFKFWFLDENGENVLFKQGRPNTGENWAEKVSCEIAELLGLPHAKYELAKWRDFHGVITPSFVKPDSHLVHGNEILRPGQTNRYGTKHHLVRIVMTIIRSAPIQPINISGELLTANEVFLGYLMLDALIGNSDRHDENWALIATPEGIKLAPTFDHASSLGRNESDEKRVERLETKDKGNDIEAYASRTRSALYNTPNDSKTLSPLEAFQEASKYTKTKGIYWLNKLKELKDDDINEILSKIPEEVMSLPAKQFAYKIICINKTKLLKL